MRMMTWRALYISPYPWVLYPGRSYALSGLFAQDRLYTFHPLKQGPADVRSHVTGCHFTQEMRVSCAINDVASMWIMLARSQSVI